jgi:hypothetical protein
MMDDELILPQVPNPTLRDATDKDLMDEFDRRYSGVVIIMLKNFEHIEAERPSYHFAGGSLLAMGMCRWMERFLQEEVNER